MNSALVDRIVNAVLYEGYILYPYRPSVKNRQRWTFGGLFPQEFCEAQDIGEAWSVQTECLVQGTSDTVLGGKVRFLHLVDRIVGELPRPVAELAADREPAFRPVVALQVGSQRYCCWQEATECQIAPGELSLHELLARPRCHEFAFPLRRRWEALREPGGAVVGVLVRQQQPLEGAVELRAETVEEGLFRVTVRVCNYTPLADAAPMSREEAQRSALASTHTVLGVRGGAFVSLLDPPERWQAVAAHCRNIGTWPVLVGKEGQRDTLLSAPIILYDYPQVAPESPGDLFDGTEIDEILTLRILTLTEEEKQQALAVDERARALLERTEALDADQLRRLHGTIRSLRPV